MTYPRTGPPIPSGPSAHDRVHSGRAAQYPFDTTSVVWSPNRSVRRTNGTRRLESILIQNTSRPGAKATGFEHFQLRSELHQSIVESGYQSPRPIQAEAIPPALEGRDVLGLAQTGTGKTAAFVLPILEQLMAGRRGKHPRALAVTPTRELAAQVHAEFERLAEFTPIRSTSVFGGVPIARQIRALKARPDVVVACPGRLLDLMNRGEIQLDKVEVLVLDEADHMFDMGFLPDVRRILRALPKQRQNLLFSATMPKEVRKLADSVLHKPAVIELANSRPTETIAHALMRLDEGHKLGSLEHILCGDDFRSAIVFLRTKRRAKQLAQRLGGRGFRAVALQGNMSQGQRERAMRDFKGGACDVLVATDIAARGLDIAGVSHVVNYDVPSTPDAYTHRIGRTGRAEATGIAYTFVTHTDATMIRSIERRLGEPIERCRAPEVGRVESIKGPGSASQRGRGAGGKQGRGSGSRGGGSRSGNPRSGGSRRKNTSQPGATGTRSRQGTQGRGQTSTATTDSGPKQSFGAGVAGDSEAHRKRGPQRKGSGGRMRGRRGGGKSRASARQG